MYTYNRYGHIQYHYNRRLPYNVQKKYTQSTRAPLKCSESYTDEGLHEVLDFIEEPAIRTVHVPQIR